MYWEIKATHENSRFIHTITLDHLTIYGRICHHSWDAMNYNSMMHYDVKHTSSYRVCASLIITPDLLFLEVKSQFNYRIGTTTNAYLMATLFICWLENALPKMAICRLPNDAIEFRLIKLAIIHFWYGIENGHNH